jgi:spermidine/putrescine transport system permease protein
LWASKWLCASLDRAYHFNLPYVIFSVLPKLRQSSDMLYEAALDLGCTPMQAIQKVVIPDIMPGIVSGFLMAFTLSLDDFVISFFAGNGVDNLSMYIYASARRGVNPRSRRSFSCRSSRCYSSSTSRAS